MLMQVILDSLFARPGSTSIGSGKKGEFRDRTKYGNTSSSGNTSPDLSSSYYQTVDVPLIF